MFLILVLYLMDLKSVVVEENSVLWGQTVSKVISLEDSLEFSEEFQWVFNAGNNLEVLVNVLLEFGFNGWNINVEFDEVSIKCVVCVVKELVVLLLEGIDISVEGL